MSHEFQSADFDYQQWVDNTNNIMLVEDKNVGLATYEYPGVYSAHWFYIVRGKDARNLAKEMIGKLFNEYGVETIRGLTPVDNRPARFLVRQLGFKSYGIVDFKDRSCELFCMTKQEFNELQRNK